ncbi:hypothetical protein EZV62_004326 [Acer yangbiense]|uniref:Protein kinase domain-containing protein n=1 Tax=Acer yangbiense TaxID=1000413 RepID=A0A5C7IJN2_9ROSI|nr:hypothetical protein EZV62_004326 [Acer yangbiense]
MFLTKELMAGVVEVTVGNATGTSPTSTEFIAEVGNPTFGFAFGVSIGTLEFTLERVSKRSKQGSKEYTAEVKIISQLRHRNTVKLIGWCHEKDLILVYEFMPNGSLDSHLFKGKSLLTWDG